MPRPSLAPCMMLLLSLFASHPAAAQSFNVDLLANVNDHGGANDVWGYTAPNGDEYAILGTSSGTAFYNVTVPELPVEVGFITGPSSGWRDMKTYQTYCYIVTEGSGAPIQVVDLTDPENPTLVNTVTNGFQTAHNIFIDEVAGRAYVIGTNAGMVTYDLAIDPVNPLWMGTFNSYYIHDIYVQNMVGYAAAIFEGKVHIIDVTTPGLVQEISSWTYPGASTHNTWTDADQTILVTSDETGGGHLNFWDITVPEAAQPLGDYSASPSASAHNAFIRGDFCYVSYYTEGMRVVSLLDPQNPQEVGFYDTHSGGGLFNGLWGVYPFVTDASIIYGSDMSTGLYVFRFDNPLAGVVIDHEPLGDTVDTANDYDVVAGITSIQSTINPDSVFVHYRINDGGDVQLDMVPTGGPDEYAAPIPAQPLGTVVRYYIEATDMDGLGATHPSGAPGRRHAFVVGTMQELVAYDMEELSGWTVDPGTATAGAWERADPVGVGKFVGGNWVQVTPEDDHTPDPGVMAWVTENDDVGGAPGAHDVDGGETMLLSPILDLSGELYARLGLWLWYSNSSGGNPGEDAFGVDVSSDGGASWVPALLRAEESGEQWENIVVPIADVVDLTAAVRVRFVARDLLGPSIVEAGVDDVSIQILPAGAGVDEPGVAAPAAVERLGLAQNRPNPVRASTTIEYALTGAGHVRLGIYDPAGRLVRTLVDGWRPAGARVAAWDGRDGRGRRVAAGVYFYRLEATGAMAARKLLLAR